MTYSQNDDDLFEYDPEVDAEDSSAALQSEAYSPSSSNKNKTIEDFISSAKQLVDEISSDENSPFDNKQMLLHEN